VTSSAAGRAWKPRRPTAPGPDVVADRAPARTRVERRRSSGIAASRSVSTVPSAPRPVHGDLGTGDAADPR
jgi:hypothetical protein